MMAFRKAEEIWDAGYAFPLYDITETFKTLRFRGEDFVLTGGEVRRLPEKRVLWVEAEIPVYPIDDVRRLLAARTLA